MRSASGLTREYDVRIERVAADGPGLKIARVPAVCHSRSGRVDQRKRAVRVRDRESTAVAGPVQCETQRARYGRNLVETREGAGRVTGCKGFICIWV